MPSTTEQNEVILYRDGHLLVPAAPGSGKTFAMVERVYALLNEGVDPNRLLVMMFNVSAREDFERRLKNRLKGTSLSMPDVFTFHAFGLRLCKAMHKKGVLPDFKLNEHGWIIQKLARAAIQAANEGLTDEDKIVPDNTNVEQLIEYIEMAKNELLEFSSDELVGVPTSYIDAMKQFEAMRHDSRMRTFTDLLYDPARLIVQDDALRLWVGNRYDHIIGDEAQDMNQVQITLMKAIAGTRAQVCIVGDEDQSIYEWRGSRPEYMVRLFEQEFPGAKRIPLTKTFRFGHQVALLANHAVTKNKERMDKLCLPATDTKTKVDIILSKVGSEGDDAARAIKSWLAQGNAYAETVVLVREYSHSVAIETKFLEENIPYRIVGADPFFMRREALALRGTLLLAGNGIESEIDQDRRKAIISAMMSVPATYVRSDMIDILADGHYPDASSLINAVRHLSRDSSLSGSTRKKLTERADAWEELLASGLEKNAAAYLEHYINHLDIHSSILSESGKKETALAKWRTVKAIQDIALHESFTVTGMVDFLDDMKLKYDQMSDSDSVLITSIHRAKGLEWPHVILPGLKEGSFPSYDEEEGIDDATLESERRLYYVGVTRAKRQLTMIAPEDQELLAHAASGNHIPQDTVNFHASRFLYESNLRWSIAVGASIENGLFGEEMNRKVVELSPDTSQIIRRYISQLS